MRACACVCVRVCASSYLEVLLDLVSALLMTREGADCRRWAKVFIFYTERERERGEGSVHEVSGADGLLVCIR